MILMTLIPRAEIRCNYKVYGGIVMADRKVSLMRLPALLSRDTAL
jgi:hypothetical protein